MLGVVGIGKFGSRVAGYAQALGMKVICNDPFVTEEYTRKLGIELVSMEELFKRSDFITFHIPKTKETARMINKDKISTMKDGVRLINVSRGGIIDEADLKDALVSKKVAAAALDVFEVEPVVDNPLVDLDNVIATPHLGASTVEAQVNVAIDVAEQIIEVLNGNSAKAAVNIPSMRPDMMGPVKPFLSLAEKLGKIAAQLVDSPVSEVEISYLGELSAFESAPLTVAALKGILEPAMGDSVNLVNATLAAKERGITVKEIKSDNAENFSNMISVSILSSKGKKTVSGTAYGSFGERIVKIDNFRTDVAPAAYMLVISHKDIPGIIGRIGTLLGNKGINIASMDVGRETIGGQAVMVLTIDTAISGEVMKEILIIEGIADTKLVKM